MSKSPFTIIEYTDKPLVTIHFALLADTEISKWFS